jgi:enoyl-CoA hydratase/carnithine racemase
MSDFKNYKYLIVRESNFKLEIILNRPDKKNAINSEMLEELMSCTDYANENDSVRAVVYKSTGDVFCAGLDLYDFKENNMTNALSDVFNLLHKPKLAVLEGDAYGGGVLLILCCNYVISKSDVKLCLPEVDRGLFPFQVMDALIKVMPAKKALDWCIGGLSVYANYFLEINFFDEINNNI